MSLVARFTWKKKARLVREALRSAGVDAAAAGVGDAVAVAIAVVDRPALARLLADGHAAPGATVAAVARADVRAGAALGAIVGEPKSDAELDAWAAAVRPGGVVAVVGRGPREDASRRVLCAGLVDIEQRVAG